MFRNTLFLAVAVSTTLAIGCDQSSVEDDALLEPVSLRSTADEQGLLDFLNDYEVSTEEVLDDDCAIRSDSAKHIDRFRTGQDKTYGTADDQVIDSEETLDSIQMVGPWTIDQLYACAEDFGYIAPGCGMTGNWSETFSSGDDWEQAVPAALVEEIESYEGLDDLCGDMPSAFSTSTFAEVTIYHLDCEVTTYEVVWVQTIDLGIQEILTHYYDAELDLFDGSCEV